MNAYQTKFMVYYEVHRMSLEGYSISKICRTVLLNWRTVHKLLSMNETEYELAIDRKGERNKELQPYEGFVKSRLTEYQDTSSAQMHDWLKEHFNDFPPVSPKTVFNFVTWVRQEHRLPKISPLREFEMVEELPYGKQAQVDFGEYNLRNNLDKGVKVFFFTIMLSRSRYKYLWFLDQYFTSDLAISAHEQAFAFFGGIPDEIVYDQDKLFLVRENKGDIILTDRFRAYTRERPFKLHFCRKADPQSKGKVENMVKYVKQNFLYNRAFCDIETLNQQALCWLDRTANRMPHSFTRKPPYQEWNTEQLFLIPYTAYPQPAPLAVPYTVRKDNSISWKGNLYSLPLGTYQGRGSQVGVKVESGQLVMLSLQGMEICRHRIAVGKGQKIKNTDHGRDKTAAIDTLIDSICQMLDDPQQGKTFLMAVRAGKPRYMRDQLLLFKQVIEESGKGVIIQALTYCCLHKIASASDFKAVVAQYSRDGQTASSRIPESILQMNPLSGQLPAAALIQPQRSAIADYENILKL